MDKTKKPRGLKIRGSKFWGKATAQYVLEDAHDLERLEMACKCLDENDEAESIIKKVGMFVSDRYGGTREHPAVKVIKDNRILFARLIRELGLDLVTNDPRLPGRY